MNKKIKYVAVVLSAFVLMATFSLLDVLKINATETYSLEVNYSISEIYSTTNDQIYYDGDNYHYIIVTDNQGVEHKVIPSIYTLVASDGSRETTYCIEPVKLTVNQNAYDSISPDDFNVVLSKFDQLELQKISYFGYGYNGDVSDLTCFATQLAIWDYQGYSFSGVNNNVLSQVNEIKNRIEGYENSKFLLTENQTNITLNGYGKENGVVLKDDNMLFSNWYQTGNIGDFEIEKTEDSLLIYATKGVSSTSGTLSFQDVDPSLKISSGMDIIYKNASDPDVQKLMKISGLDFSRFDISVNIAQGKVVIDKVEIGGTNEVIGAHLEVIDAADQSLVAEWISDGTPHIINDLVAGNYVLREIQAPDGYVTAEEIPFSITYDGHIQSLQMEDDFTKVEINKFIMNNNVKTKECVKGAKLQILDKETMNVVYSFTTDGESEQLNKLLGVNKTYILQEVETPEGFEKSDDIEFTVQNNGDVQSVIMYDRVIRTRNAIAPATGDVSNVELQYTLILSSAIIFLGLYLIKVKNNE